MPSPDPAEALRSLKPAHDFFVGVDSDGCAFDTMEIKHKECFIPNIVAYWGLQPVARFAREAAEFVNLYSKWRGINRWPALTMAFDLLAERPEVRKRGASIPAAPKVREFIQSGLPLGNPALKDLVNKTGDPELKQALEWSEAVNRAVEWMVHGVPPFPRVRESLQHLEGVADVIVVSATPGEALVREWQEHDLAKHVRVIAGQEMGTKKEHLALAARGKYAGDHILMIGDAPGDMQAARANGALFFPVNPGNEDLSWERFFTEGMPRFLAGRYAGAYEAGLIAEFEAGLPDTPPWKRAAPAR
jgi:phosphoglycolate phosphatase-like HAD superfamily hydrolase